MDLDEMYALAGRHMISAIVAFALESAGHKDKSSENAIALALRRTVLFESEWGEIRKLLDASEI